MVGFEFVSGTVAPTGGDASNAFASQGVKVVNGGMLEGVYVDSIYVNGTDPMPEIPLATSVDALNPVQNNHYFPVSFSTNDPTEPFAYTHLYYRQDSGGPWTEYNSSSNPDGKFYASPIMFLAPADGRYEFFTQGFDQKNGSEALRDAADAATIVDTLAPLTSINVTGSALPSGIYDSPITFTLGAVDDGSGVNATYYRIDNGSWVHYDGSPVSLKSGGVHSVQYYSTDLAGNTEVTRTNQFTIEAQNTNGQGPSGPSNSALAPLGTDSLMIIGVLLVGVVVAVVAGAWYAGRLRR